MHEKAKLVYDDLKKRILFDKLPNGCHLAEIKLAQEYSVSRLYIKSALAELASEQLVEHKTGRGYFVLSFTPEAINEINILREHLTAIIVENIIDTITAKDISRLKKILAKLRVFIDNDMYDEAIEEVIIFYSTLQSYSTFTRVVSILNTYNEYIFSIITHSVRKRADHEKGYQFLSSLVQCLEEHDLEASLKVVSKQADYVG